MTANEFRSGLESYADVAVTVGVNLQPGQELFVRAPVEAAELVEAVKDRALRLGCPVVRTWMEDVRARHEILLEGGDRYGEEEDWLAMSDAAQSGSAMLAIRTEHPGLMSNIEPTNLQKYKSAYLAGTELARKICGAGQTNWSVICAPSQEWADAVYPDKNSGVRVDKLWDTLFYVARLKEADPIEAWRKHNEDLRRRSLMLDGLGITALRFTSDDSDLLIGLADGHKWEGGLATTSDGRHLPFVPNIPTEEVFTMPHRLFAEGHVAATRPLVYQGVTLEGFELCFQNGRVVKIKSKQKDKALLWEMINHDEGAGRLGEIGLVGNDSPISVVGTVFGNTLLDENASTHLALGDSYPTTMADGIGLTEEGYASRGGNTSATHTDFMIGSDTMNVRARTSGSPSVSILVRGNWQF